MLEFLPSISYSSINTLKFPLADIHKSNLLYNKKFVSFVEARADYLNLFYNQKNASIYYQMNGPGFIAIDTNKYYFRLILENHGVWGELQENGGLEFNLIFALLKTC